MTRWDARCCCMWNESRCGVKTLRGRYTMWSCILHWSGHPWGQNGTHSLLKNPLDQHDTQGCGPCPPLPPGVLRPPLHSSNPAHFSVSKDKGSLTILVLVRRAESHKLHVEFGPALIWVYWTFPTSAHTPEYAVFKHVTWLVRKHIRSGRWCFGLKTTFGRDKDLLPFPGKSWQHVWNRTKTFKPGAWNILETHQTSCQLSPEWALNFVWIALYFIFLSLKLS